MTGIRAGALRHRDFRWFFLATSVDRLGSMMTPVAYAFAVLHVSNSATSLSQVMAAEVGANVVCLLFGGVVADRFSRRVVLQSAFLSSAAVLGVTGALLLSGRATVPILALLAALAGAVSAFAMPAMQGIVPQLVPTEDLQPANALVSFVRNGAQLLGPVAGTAIVAMGGAAWVLLIDAATYAASSALLLPVGLPAPAAAGSGILRQLREGWAEFRARTWVWVVVVAFGVLNAISAGVIGVLGPVVAQNTPTLGVAGWGLALGAQAAGMVLASLALLRIRLRHPLRVGMAAIAVSALFYAGLGLFPVTWPLMAAAFLGGVGIEVFSTGWTVALGEHVPTAVLSRVSSYDMVGSFVAMPVGMLTYGALASVLPVTTLLVASGIAYAVIALATLAVRDVRTMGRVDASDAPDAAAGS